MTLRAFPERPERPYSTSAIACFSALTPADSSFFDISAEEQPTVCDLFHAVIGLVVRSKFPSPSRFAQTTSLRPLSQMERHQAVAASTVPTGAGALRGFFSDEPPSWAAAVVAVCR